MRIIWHKISRDALEAAFSGFHTETSRRRRTKAFLIQEAEAVISGDPIRARVFLDRLHRYIAQDREQKRLMFRPKR